MFGLLCELKAVPRLRCGGGDSPRQSQTVVNTKDINSPRVSYQAYSSIRENSFVELDAVLKGKIQSRNFEMEAYERHAFVQPLQEKFVQNANNMPSWTGPTQVSASASAKPIKVDMKQQ